jgi:hypothetical protein
MAQNFLLAIDRLLFPITELSCDKARNFLFCMYRRCWLYVFCVSNGASEWTFVQVYLSLFETLSDVERQEAGRPTVLESDGYSKNIAILVDALCSDAIYWYDIQR